MFGANGSATPTGDLLQLRALDWDVDGKHLASSDTLFNLIIMLPCSWYIYSLRVAKLYMYIILKLMQPSHASMGLARARPN